MGARRPFFVRGRNLPSVYDTKRELQSEMAAKVSASLPGVEVLAVELRGPERACVYLDRDSVVDHALCAEVTNILRDYLDRYSLEVSSPGFERPLRTREHFAAEVGRRAAVRTSDGARMKGEIVEAGTDAVTLSVGDERREVPYGAIVRGN